MTMETPMELVDLIGLNSVVRRRASSPPPGSPVPSARPRDSCVPPRRSDQGPTGRLQGLATWDVEVDGSWLVAQTHMKLDYIMDMYTIFRHIV